MVGPPPVVDDRTRGSQGLRWAPQIEDVPLPLTPSRYPSAHRGVHALAGGRAVTQRPRHRDLRDTATSMNGDPVAMRFGRGCAVGILTMLIAAVLAGCASSPSSNGPSSAGPAAPA